MRGGEYWLMRPVERSLCRYESLLDGTLRLGDIARMHELIDVVDENRRRARRARERR